MMSSSSSPSPRTTFFVPGSASSSTRQRKTGVTRTAPLPSPFCGEEIMQASQAAHLANPLPLLVGYRLHRKTRIFHQDHIGEFGIGFDGGQSHRLRHVLYGLHVDKAEASRFIGRILAVLADHFDDADNLALLARMIKETEVALLHRLHVFGGLEIAHAAPGLALGALRFLMFP